MKIKCECPHIGEVPNYRLGNYDTITEQPYVNHAPGECKCTNELKLYLRGKQRLYLCSICNMFGDVEV